MAILLFKLHHVPYEEAVEVRRVLDDAGIEYYETTAGNWGVSLAAIWLADERDLARAKQLLAEFQSVWLAQHRQAITEPFVQRLLRQPFKFICALIAAAAILYLSIAPFTGAWS